MRDAVLAAGARTGALRSCFAPGLLGATAPEFVRTAAAHGFHMLQFMIAVLDLHDAAGGWSWGPADYPPSRRLSGPEETARMRLRINPKKPTMGMIKKIAAAESIRAGQGYVDAEAVIPVGVDRGMFSARVVGGEAYDVTASLGYGGGRSYCTCPHYGDGACAHVAAILLYASKNFAQLIGDERNRGNSGRTLGDLPADQLRRFLAEEMRMNADMEKRFLARFGKTAVRPNVRADLDEVYYRMGEAGYYGGRVDFDGHLEAAQLSAKMGDYDEAIRICREIAGVIQDNMENVDDSYAHYSTISSMALDDMADYIIRQGLDHEQKRRHISYLHGMLVADEYGIDTYYERALSKICTGDKDKAYLDGLRFA